MATRKRLELQATVVVVVSKGLLCWIAWGLFTTLLPFPCRPWWPNSSTKSKMSFVHLLVRRSPRLPWSKTMPGRLPPIMIKTENSYFKRTRCRTRASYKITRKLALLIQKRLTIPSKSKKVSCIVSRYCPRTVKERPDISKTFKDRVDIALGTKKAIADRHIKLANPEKSSE